MPATGPSVPWYRNGTGLGYSAPLSWTEEERKATANSILTEYTNLFVSGAPPPSPRSSGARSAPHRRRDCAAVVSAPVSLLLCYRGLTQDFWYDEHWQDFRHCGPTPTCPACPYVPGTAHGSCSRWPNGTRNPAVPPSPGGFITNVDAMVALTQPRCSNQRPTP